MEEINGVQEITIKEIAQAPEITKEALPGPWKLSEKGVEAIKQGVAMYQTKHGMYSSIPIICKGKDCVYAQFYPEIHDDSLTEGERCPVEIALIISKYDAYSKELEIEESNAVDRSMIKDLIDCDVQLLRAENKMAIEGDFVKDVTIGISDDGDPIQQEQISKAAEYKEKIQAKRNRVLELLNSTRKDKAGDKLMKIMDPSTYAKELMIKAQQSKSISDADFFDELVIVEDEHLEYSQKVDEVDGEEN